MKRLQIIALSALLLGMPLTMMAQSERDDVETEVQSATLTISGTKVHISNADGSTLEIFNLTGTKVASYRIDSNDKTVSLNNLNKGCYILKVGKVVRKISIR